VKISTAHNTYIFKTLEAISIKNTALHDMALYSLAENNEDFEEINCSHTKVRIVRMQQNIPHICW
jgi:hypothetical protein